ncbi:hypothetical protein [Photorhabdus australis]|uniref:hypothetical protein n=1 Tax=Photorhabdus australis TaxID=286156 RepID=UPI000562C3C9|nr:hypothetical protein [Photorhabdus australis]
MKFLTSPDRRFLNSPGDIERSDHWLFYITLDPIKSLSRPEAEKSGTKEKHDGANTLIKGQGITTGYWHLSIV